MKRKALSRARLDEVVREINRGERPAEIIGRGEGYIELIDGTMLRQGRQGNWMYRGWSNAGRRFGLDRIRPDDSDPAAVMRPYGIDLPDSPDSYRGECYSCGQALLPNGDCTC